MDKKTAWENILEKSLGDSTVCIVGLGYVGLPLAQAFAKKLKVIGFDLDKQKVFTLQKSSDDRRPTTDDRRLTTDDQNGNLIITSSPEKIKPADFFIICVPTPVTRAKFPDLSPVEYAARMVGANMRKNSTIILESTVYPGVTEEIVKPILEQESGFILRPGLSPGLFPGAGQPRR